MRDGSFHPPPASLRPGCLVRTRVPLGAAPAVVLAASLALAASLLVSSPARAAAPAIARIRFVGVSRDAVAAHELHRRLAPLLGRPATPETLRQAILLVDKTQAFGDGQVEVELLGQGKALLEVRLSENPRRIDQLLFSKESWRPDADFGKHVEKLLRSRALALDSRQGGIYHPYLVDLDREKLATLLQEQGYLDARITYRAHRHQRLIRLVFRIELGQQVSVREVRFTGTSHPTDELLRELQTRPRGNGLLGPSRLVRAKLEADREKLVAFFRRKGHKDVVVSTREHRVSRDEVDVEIIVHEGVLYRIARVKVTGQPLPAELASALGAKEGAPWSREVLQADAERIVSWLRDRGYPDAELDPTSSFKPPAAAGEPGQASVVFTVRRRAQVRVEKIWLSGNTITSQETLLKMISVKPGDLFRQSALDACKQDVLRSGLFREVAVEVLPGSDANRRFVVFRVVEAHRLRLDAAGPTLTLLNLNLLSFPSSMAELEHGTLFAGGGQELQARLAKDDLRFSLRDPYIYSFLVGTMTVSRTVSRPGGKELTVWGAMPTFGLSLAQGKLTGQLFWRGERADFEEAASGVQLPPELAAVKGGLVLGSGGLITRLDLTQRDDADRFTYRGLSLELRYEQASPYLGSELEFVGGGAGWSGYLPLQANSKGQHTVLTLRGQLDWLHPLDGDVLPYHRRFSPTLRGYSSTTLGRLAQLGPGGAELTVGGEGAFALELGLRLPIPLGRRNALMPFAVAGGLWEGKPPTDLSQVFSAGGAELTFSFLDERLEGSLWLAYPFGGPGSSWEASYVGGSLGGSL